MAESAEQRAALKAKVAEISEKYRANISTMGSKELLDEFEKRALMASYGYQDPTTAMMLKEAKAELLRRTRGYKIAPDEDEPAPEARPERQEPARPTLFG